MTITIIPRSTPGSASTGASSSAQTTRASAPGKLATTLLSVAVAGMAEPSRFRRGRAYLSERAVARLEVSPGLLHAIVVGSRPEPYGVNVEVQLVPRPADLTEEPTREQVMRLMPDSDDLRVSCTCPDDESPCKHVIAALLSLANELTERPDLMIEWVCGSSAPAERVAVGSRAKSERHLRLVQPPPPPSPYLSDEWRRFEGDDCPPPPTWNDQLSEAAVVVVATPIVDGVDIGAVLRSAIDAIVAP